MKAIIDHFTIYERGAEWHARHIQFDDAGRVTGINFDA